MFGNLAIYTDRDGHWTGGQPIAGSYVVYWSRGSQVSHNFILKICVDLIKRLGRGRP